MRSIDAIRGFSQKNDDDRWNVFIYKSPFWNNLTKIKTLFISRGNPDIIDIKHPDVFESIYPNETYHLENDGKKLIIPGMTKPLNGIHQPFENTQAIKACYDGIYHKKWPLINTDRKNHSHGIPLDIYDLIQSLIERSEYYYSINKYVHSAILSNEAIEIMNGFHKSLMVKAYHLYAISENAVSMNAIGVDERELQEDAQIRISKIERTVRWFYRKKNNEGWEQSKNVLNQIYNDCRRFCKDKEHFLSEEAFVGAMGHSNDGINIFREISCLFKIINWHKNGTE